MPQLEAFDICCSSFQGMGHIAKRIGQNEVVSKVRSETKRIKDLNPLNKILWWVSNVALRFSKHSFMGQTAKGGDLLCMLQW